MNHPEEREPSGASSPEFDVSILGPGKVGTSLGVLYARSGGRVVAVGGRNRERAVLAARQIGGDTQALSMADAARASDHVILAVSDDAIRTTCEELVREHAFRQGAVVLHCSGALGRAELESARQQLQCSTGAMHPLQTFADVASAVEMLPGTYCFYEADAPAAAFILHFARAVEMTAVPLEARLKSLYHASAVMACNYLAALLDAAIETATLAGVDASQAWPALRPLVESTIRNVDRGGTLGALTGPIARGDVETVRRHLQDLDRESGELGRLYRALGERTLSMIRRTKRLSPERRAELQDLLGTANDSE